MSDPGSPVGARPYSSALNTTSSRMTDDDANKSRLNNDGVLPWDTGDTFTHEPSFYLTDDAYRARLGIMSKDLYSFALANDWIMWKSALRAMSTQQEAPNKSAETTTFGFNTKLDAQILNINLGQARFYLPLNFTLSGDRLNISDKSLLLRAKFDSIGARIERIPTGGGDMAIAVKNVRTYNLSGTLEAVDALKAVTGATTLTPDRLSSDIYEVSVEGRVSGILSLMGEDLALGIRSDKLNHNTLGSITARGANFLFALSFANMREDRGLVNVTMSRRLLKLGENGGVNGTFSVMNLAGSQRSVILGTNINILKVKTPAGSFDLNIAGYVMWSRIGDNSPEISSFSFQSPDQEWDGLQVYDGSTAPEQVTRTFGYTAPEMTVNDQTELILRVVTNNGNGRDGVSFLDPATLAWLAANADVEIKDVEVQDLTRDPAHRVIPDACREIVGKTIKHLTSASGVKCHIPVDATRGKMQPKVEILVSTDEGDFVPGAIPKCKIRIIIDRIQPPPAKK